MRDHVADSMLFEVTFPNKLHIRSAAFSVQFGAQLHSKCAV